MTKHLPVLAKEAVNFLHPQAGGTYVDCTLGGGGHIQALLNKLQNTKYKIQNTKIIGIDWDAEALKIAKEKLAPYQNITYIQDNFTHLKKIISQKVNGILFDLGLSSLQLNDPARGFSLQKDGPLDMRIDQRQKLTAGEVINYWSERELEKIFRQWGEERFAKRIAKAIGDKRRAISINSTFQLRKIIEEAIPTWRKRESITRIFQALRIAVNHELENLKIALKDAISLLKQDGKIVVISYHSLEDRIAKHSFREYAKQGMLKILTKKPVTPTKGEIDFNPRSKSAKLRAAEKQHAI